MNEPIISPWMFYFIDTVDNVKGALYVLTILCSVGIVFYPLWSEGVEKEKCKKHLKRFCVVFLITGILNIFIPASNTVIKIFVAQHITLNNIEKAGNITSAAIDTIIEKVAKAAKEIGGDKK